MKKLLIVIDMQNDFINGSLGSVQAQEIVGNVKSKIESYNKNARLVIFTRDTHYDNYLETQEGRSLPVKHCIKHTDGWRITDALNADNAIVWNKESFGSPELAEFIRRELNVDEIELVGLCTDICVISNALMLKAFMPEVPIIVDAGCCAGVTAESHKNALEAMKMCQINIINE